MSTRYGWHGTLAKVRRSPTRIQSSPDIAEAGDSLHQGCNFGLDILVLAFDLLMKIGTGIKKNCFMIGHVHQRHPLRKKFEGEAEIKETVRVLRS